MDVSPSNGSELCSASPLSSSLGGRAVERLGDVRRPEKIPGDRFFESSGVPRADGVISPDAAVSAGAGALLGMGLSRLHRYWATKTQKGDLT